MTPLNLYGIGREGLMQLATGRLHSALAPQSTDPATAYTAVFNLYAALIVAGLAVCAVSRDRTD